MVSITSLELLDCSLPAAVTERLREKKDQLQMMPSAAMQALEILKDPDCGIAKFSQAIQRDVKLASGILSMANSVIYSPGHPVAILDDAVINVGFRQCKNLIETCCASSLMKDFKLEDKQVRDALWRHSLTTATIATQLNRTLGLGFQGEEFTAGLLHDIGRLLLCSCFPGDFSKFDAMDFCETVDTPVREQLAIETDHCGVGCSFAISNRLPEEIAESIRFHHNPGRATISAKLTATIAAADHLANHLASEAETTYDVSLNYGLTALDACLETVSVSDCADSIEPLLEKVAANVSAMLHSSS